ncbi:GDSL-type esterase/lipase family protein [Labrenzia sp. VG12]|uniref:GDSL-type esterase/lipase family protein n=1 Tax=Labrenzia sp. VG12 TaxID=2021862 RepID=UPI000B8C607C|nr:GDSL-type esterase/lipase family protein [Labrenzia sp. VG12]ASP33437.1 lipase [Labrenzia sp. VG12]
MRDLRICFVGDSYVNGSGDETGLGWTGRLCARRISGDLRLTRYDLGIRGETTDQIGARWQSECTPRLPEGADNRVVLQFGINDVAVITGQGRHVAPEASLASAAELVSAAAAAYPTLWVGLPPANVACSPMHPSAGLEISFRQEDAIALNGAFKDLAAKLGIAYLDIQTPLLGDTAYLDSLTRGDRMHPDGEGYARITDLVDAWPAWSDWFEV